MNKFAILLAPLALAVTACETYPPQDDPYGPGGYPPAPYPQEPIPPYPPGPPMTGDYRAIGTEPFWDLTIGRDMVFTDRGNNIQVVQPTPPVINGVAGEIYRTPRLDVNIVHARCSDGMSDRVYPDTVDVRVDGRQYRGCGGVPNDAAGPGGGSDAPSLDRTRWGVVAVNGRPTPPGDYFVAFDNGRLSAEFGCNAIGAGYTQTGSTLDAGVLIATRKACTDMSFENQGTAVLDQLMTIQWLDNSRIALASSAGRLDLVRR